MKILVTGSEGLIGRALCAHLRLLGHDVDRVDLRASDAPSRGDVRDRARMSPRLDRCDGVVHLAAVSRVITAERHPLLCQETNVDALRHLLDAASRSPSRPWVLFASSREVYGQPPSLPANEDTPLAPVNLYGRSKVDGETLCAGARSAGLRVAVVRLSNVYGSTTDHVDRVVPAFVRAALAGAPLRLDGEQSTFDFTHLDDTVDGLVALVDLLSGRGSPPPPIHLTTGVTTTLAELARTAIRAASSLSPVVHAPPRAFDVARFVGDPSLACRLLGWSPRVSVDEGLRRLVDDVRTRDASVHAPAFSEAP